MFKPNLSLASLASAMSNIRGKYHFTPFTQKNIGRNYFKTGNFRHRPHQGKKECVKRVGTQLPEVKITPRREGDFTGKAFKHLHHNYHG